MWLIHVVAGIALLIVMLVIVPDFEEICMAKEWPIPIVTTRIFGESRLFVNYLWVLSPVAALIDLALLVALNVAGNRWRFVAGAYHNLLVLAILLNISFAFLTSHVVYRAYLHPEVAAQAGGDATRD
jgi:type II secretory pathway component PulF